VLKFDVTPDGSRLVAIGNFTRINGLDRYQIGILNLTTNPVSVLDWSTQRFTTACSSSFDSYMRDIDISQDGRYFVIVTTGAYSGGIGAGTLCDTASRWDLPATGPNQQPTWANYSGGDTFWGVGVAGEAVYVGGHFRWSNNPFAGDQAGPGAVDRPGLAALDPRSGIPLSWNPGRTLGVGVFDLTATARGLWIGSDTDRLGNFEFHGRVALTPTAGGRALPADFTGQLPGDVYSLGSGPTNSTVVRRAFTGTGTTGSSTLPPDGTAWSNIRGAFMVDGIVYTGDSSGVFTARSFNGTTFGAPTVIGVNGLTAFTTELRTMTGSFFDPETGRMYFTLSGTNSLFYRGFSTESRIVGAARITAVPSSLGNLNWSQVSSMFQVGDFLYVATLDGNLTRYAWTNNGPVLGNLPDAASRTVVGGPTIDGQNWSARGAFAFSQLGGGPTPNQPPAAAFTRSCSNLTCTFTSTSSDADGSVTSTAWNFGDGGTASGGTVSHTYAAAGTYSVGLTVRDDDGATASTTQSVAVSAPATQISFRAAAASDANTTAASVVVPSAVQAGDAMLLWATANLSTATVGTPSGWTLLRSVPGNGFQSLLFRRVATVDDAGQQVVVPISAFAKTSLNLLAYAGTAANPVAVQAAALETTTRTAHTTPTVTVPTAGSWAVSYWADKSSATTAWTLPAGVARRSGTVGTGSGRIASVVADAGGGVGAGSYGGLTATADSSSGNAVTWTVVLAR
jgi:PKD repeat protein